jgi:hypothetical protein
MTHDEALKILELSANATPTEIHQAYRRMAAKYHPDRNPNNKSAEEMFKTVNQANRILTGRERPEFVFQTPPPHRGTERTYQRPHRTTFREFAEFVNMIISDLESKNLNADARAKLVEFNKTFQTITRMNKFVNFAYISSVVGMLSMLAYNQIFGYDDPRIGMGVYPTIGALVIFAALTQDKLKVKVQDLKSILDELLQHAR